MSLRRRLSAATLVAPLLLWVVAAPAQASLLGVAKNDKYPAEFETTLRVAAPGVLANDSDLGTAKAVLVDGEDVRDGTLVLKSDGSFTYTPNDGFDGSDQFKYQVKSSISGLLLKANVTILVARDVAPTPTPTPKSTAPPAPTAAPTPAPTPTPTSAPTPTPTPRPAATSTPPPSSIVPLPNGSTPRPSAPTPTAGASASVTGPAAPSPSPTTVAGVGPIRGDTGGGDTGGGDTDAIIVPPDPTTVRSLDIGVPSSGREMDLSVGIDTGGIGVEWLVPTVAVTVPGLLLMLAVLAQSLGALAWIPVVRRWLGDRGVRARSRQPLAGG